MSHVHCSFNESCQQRTRLVKEVREMATNADTVCPRKPDLAQKNQKSWWDTTKISKYDDAMKIEEKRPDAPVFQLEVLVCLDVAVVT